MYIFFCVLVLNLEIKLFFHLLSFSQASSTECKSSCELPGVCLGGKLSPFSDISQNSKLEKQTLHKIHYKKNGLFTKFSIRKRTLHKIQYIGMKVTTIFWKFYYFFKTFQITNFAGFL